MAKSPEKELRTEEVAKKKNKKKEVKAKPIANGDYKSEKRLAREAAKRQELKNAAIKKIVTVCVAGVLAVAILVTGVIVAYNAVLDNGALMRSRNAMETARFKVTNAMMSYYIFDELNTYVDGIGEKNTSAYGLDLEKSLKKQQYNKTGAQTWFEYFLSIAMDETENMLIMLEGAERDGITLTAEEEAAVKTEAASLDPADYGRGVRAADIESAMLLRARADKYAEYLEASVTVTDEEIDKYIEENEEEFLEASYRYYVVKYDLDDDDEEETEGTTSSETTSSEAASEAAPAEETASEDTTSETASDSTSSEDADEEDKDKIGRDRAAAKELAKQLEESTTEEAFLNKVAELFGADLTEEEKQELIDDTLRTGLKKDDGVELSKWAFDEDTAVESTKTIEDETAGSFTVYMLTAAPAVNENRVAQIRRILIATHSDEEEDEETSEETEETEEETVDYEAEAQAIYDEWKNGEATPESFSALADEHSHDTTVDGGYYEAIYYGSLEDDLNDWIYDPARKQGDTVMLEDGDGWNILYFEALGEPQCDYEARTDLYDEKLDAAYDEIEDATVIIFHYNYMDSIPA